MNRFASRYKYLFLAGVFLIAIFLRFFQLGDIPAGITNDEANIGYDAFSIYYTGRDQWGEFFPLVSFRGFGDYRPPIYTYLTAPFISLIGLSPLALRLPSAIFSIISIVLLYLILKKLISGRAAVIGSVLFTFSPWAIGIGRVGIESNTAVTLLLSGILAFINFPRKIIYFYISIIFFVLTLYTYSGYLLLTPFVLLLMLIYYRDNLKNYMREIIIGIAVFVLLCLPLFINRDASAKVRFSQVSFLQDVTSGGIINRINDQQGQCMKDYPVFVCKLMINKPIVFGGTIIKNYISHFSVNFLYINGNETQYSILPQRGLLYIFEFLLFAAGIIWIFQNKKKEGYLLLVLLLLSVLPDTATGAGHYSRAFVMLPFLICIEVLGFVKIQDVIDSIKKPVISFGFLSLSLLIIFVSGFMFFVNYTTYFRVFNSRFSSYGYEDLMKYVHSVKNGYSKIYITSHLNDAKQYVYYLFFNRYDTVEYQKKKNIDVTQGNDGWVNIGRIGNVYFVDSLPFIDPESKSAKENILFISTPVDFPEGVKPKKYIQDLKGDTLFEAVSLKEYNKYKFQDAVL